MKTEIVGAERSERPETEKVEVVDVVAAAASPPPLKDPGSEAPKVAGSSGEKEKPDVQVNYDDGSSYSGHVKDGKTRHGHGTWQMTPSDAGTKPDGKPKIQDAYEGQWHEDKQHGKGMQRWSDGRCFTGEFEQGMFHGEGKMEWPTAKGLMLYEGQYKLDKKHGEGKFSWPDGRSYEGQWCDGSLDGNVIYTNSEGVKRTGVWKSGKHERWVDK